MNSQTNALRSRLGSVLARYGLPLTAAAWAAYQSWCAAQPDSSFCRATAGMIEFVQGWEKSTRSKKKSVSSRLTSSAAVAAASSSGVVSSSPVSVGFKSKISSRIYCRGNDFVVEATDMLFLVTSGGSIGAGTPLGNFVFYPSSVSLLGSRLSGLSQFFENYELEELIFHYSPAVSSSINGSFVMAWENDPADSVVSTDDQGVRSLLSFPSNVVTSVWEDASFKCKLDKKRLYTTTGSDARLFAAGRLQLAVLANMPASSIFGTLWCSYRVKLSSPSEITSFTAPRKFLTIKSTATVQAIADDTIANLRSAGTTNALDVGVITNAAGFEVVQLSVGYWVVDFLMQGSSTASAVTVAAVIDNVNLDQPLITSTTSDIDKASTTTSSNQSVYHRMGITVPFGQLAQFRYTFSGSLPLNFTAGTVLRVVAADFDAGSASSSKLSLWAW